LRVRLAEVIGSAIGLNLLFGFPAWGIASRALDVLIVLFLQHKGFGCRGARRGADRDHRGLLPVRIDPPTVQLPATPR